jgi:hypothetical protein
VVRPFLNQCVSQRTLIEPKMTSARLEEARKLIAAWHAMSLPEVMAMEISPWPCARNRTAEKTPWGHHGICSEAYARSLYEWHPGGDAPRRYAATGPVNAMPCISPWVISRAAMISRLSSRIPREADLLGQLAPCR